MFADQFKRPIVSQEDGAYVLDMICSLLEPLESHKQLLQSQKPTNAGGKKATSTNTKNKTEEYRPEIASSLTIGFNNTNEVLEKQARKFYDNKVGSQDPEKLPTVDDTTTTKNDKSNSDVWAVFVCKPDMKSPLLWSHFPSLCAAASLAKESTSDPTDSITTTEGKNTKNVRLIQLPAGACSRISNAAGLDRVSVIGLRRGTNPATIELEKRILENQIGVVEAPGWMNQIQLNPTVISSLKTSAPIKPAKGGQQKKKGSGL